MADVSPKMYNVVHPKIGWDRLGSVGFGWDQLGSVGISWVWLGSDGFANAWDQWDCLESVGII